MSQEQLVVDPKRSKLVQPERKTKIKTIRPIEVDGKIIPENKEVLVSEEEAKQFCDLSFDGPYSFYGEQRDPVSHKITRAVRV